MTKIQRITVGVPAYGGFVHAGQIRMWMELGNAIGASPERFELMSVGYVDVNGIDRARNLLLATALQTGSDWLLMIDADTWVEALGEEDAGFQLLRMISDAERAEATIVGAAVAHRGAPDAEHSVMVYVENPESSAPGSLTKIPIVGMPRRLHKVDALATAVFAVDVRRIGETQFHAPSQLGELGEDLRFCQSIAAQGGTVFVDPRVNTRHLGRAAHLGNTPTEKTS